MTKRTAYEEMVEALGAVEWVFRSEGDWDWRECPCCQAGEHDGHEDGCLLAAALTRAKKVPVEVGMYGTGAREDLVYHRVFGGRPTDEDVLWVKRESAGHKDCVCIACACKRQLETGRGTLQ